MHGFHHQIKLLAAFILSGTMGCGSSTKVGQQIFNVHIYGSAISPDGANGNKDPVWQKYTLTGVSFINAGGADATVMYDGTSPQTYQVVDRPQIIFSKNIKDYNAKSFAGITATFSPQITGAEGKKADYTFTLPSPTLELDQDFKIETGKGLDFSIQVQWKNTVNGDTMSAPAFDLSISQ